MQAIALTTTAPSLSSTGPAPPARAQGIGALSALTCLAPASSPISVARDAAVLTLGFVDIDLDGRLVFAGDSDNLARALAASGVAAVLTTPALAREADLIGGSSFRGGLALAEDPRRAFVELHNALVAETEFYGPSQPSVIHRSSRVHPRAYIDPMNVVVGPDCRIDAGATVLEGSRLDAGVRIMTGAVVGGSGFQTMRFGQRLVDFEHAGGVEIGAGTVIMATAVIARAVFRQSTRIGSDCRIGNGAFVSHNARIGAGSLVGHGSVIAGNTSIGVKAVIGPGAICVDRISIGDGAMVTTGAVATRDVAAGERVSGNFAVPHGRLLAHVKRLACGAAD